jgi:tetratricopeptide (TPR) repeat protein
MIPQQTQKRSRRALVLKRSLLIAGAAALFLANLGHAQHAEEEALERSMTFVELLNDATELFNEGRLEEAVSILQTLAADYADLDVHGLAVMALGDALSGLNRFEDARAAYLRALNAHAELREALGERLIELDLLGPMNEGLLDYLRAAARPDGEGGASARRQLGRALAQRARELLAEAVETLRSIEPETVFCRGSRWLLSDQAALLEDLERDLAFINERMEQTGLFRLLRLEAGGEPPGGAGEPENVIESRHLRQTLRTPGGRRVEVELTQDGGSCLQVVVDGEPVILTDVQRRLLQRHQERMNAILLEAARETAAGAADVAP